jgi:HD-GYP domain-containing protein (c-di-GMP phosphodiesterase class II)
MRATTPIAPLSVATFSADKFRLKSRGKLIAATVALQALVIGVGTVLTIQHARTNISHKVEREQMDDAAHEAEALAERLEREVKGKIEPGKARWLVAQRVIESAGGSDGSVALLLDDQNRVLCHPGMKNPGVSSGDAMRRVDYSDLTLEIEGEGAIPLSGVTPWRTYVGRCELLSGASVMAVVSKPGLGAKVIVQRPGATLSAAGARVTDGMLVLGLSGAAAVLGLTALGSFLLVRKYDSMLMRINRGLEQEVVRKVKDGLKIRNSLIFGLAKLADYRDTDTGKHLERISRYCELLAEALRERFPEIEDAWIERLKLASSMHDIGKVGIPDAILLKPGALTPEERRIMEQHPLIGADTLVAIRRHVGDDDLINMGIHVALYHHERIDGTGYPFGLAGEEIPLSARLVALADVYDAMTSRRVYKPAMSHEKAREIILNARGTHLDARVVDVFEHAHEVFDAVRRELQPDGSDPEKPALIAAIEKVEEARRHAA